MPKNAPRSGTKRGKALWLAVRPSRLLTSEWMDDNNLVLLVLGTSISRDSKRSIWVTSIDFVGEGMNYLWRTHPLSSVLSLLNAGMNRNQRHWHPALTFDDATGMADVHEYSRQLWLF